MVRGWVRKGYTIELVDFDYDLKHFQVVKDGEVIATIEPDTLEDMHRIMKELSDGADVDGWEDGNGNTISVR